MFNFIRRVIIFGLFLVMGIVFLAGGIKNKVELSKPKGDLSTMTESDFYDGRFVEGTIYEIWDQFAYMEETSSSGAKKKTDFYFAMPLETSYDSDTPKFIVLEVKSGSDLTTANKMAKETDDYYGTGKEPSSGWTELHFTGKVHKLKNDVLKSFENYIKKGLEGGTKENICAFSIARYNEGSENTGLFIGIGLTVIGLGGLAFVVLRKIMSGK